MTLAQQLACVEREIEKHQYASRFGSHTTLFVIEAPAQHVTDHRLACMRAVAGTLRGLMKGDSNG